MIFAKVIILSPVARWRIRGGSCLYIAAMDVDPNQIIQGIMKWTHLVAIVISCLFINVLYQVVQWLLN